MYSNMSKNIEKIFTEIYKLHKFTKNSIKYGSIISFIILVCGSAMIFINHSIMGYDPYMEYLALSVVKAGFTNLAIVIIGSMLLDYTFNKSK